MGVRLDEEFLNILTSVIAFMLDLDEGQHGGVPVVLKCPLTDVQYSAHVSIVQEVGQFGRWREMLVKAVGQLRDALFQFLPSGGVNGCKSHFSLLFYLHYY